MFSYIVENIRERYSREELSKRYNVNLPSRETNFTLIQNVGEMSRVDGHFYELENMNKFKKLKGERAHVSILKEENALFFEHRLSWLQKILLSIMMFFISIKLRILNFINNLISKLPESLRAIIKYLVVLPFSILIMLIITLRGVLRSPGGILGVILGIIIAIVIIIPFKLFMELLGLVIAPVINKVADSMMDKPFIKKMVIGSFMKNNIFDEGIIVSESMVDNMTFELKKNLLGIETLFVIVKEGVENPSILDYILSWFLPNYFVNKRTVFATKPEYQEEFTSVFKK